MFNRYCEHNHASPLRNRPIVMFTRIIKIETPQ